MKGSSIWLSQQRPGKLFKAAKTGKEFCYKQVEVGRYTENWVHWRSGQKMLLHALHVQLAC